MTVHFIGAGPGAADLLTLRAVNLLERSSVCLFAGTYLDAAVLEHCPPGARLVDTQHHRRAFARADDALRLVAVQHGHLVAERECLAAVVGDVDHREAVFGGEPAQAWQRVVEAARRAGRTPAPDRWRPS